MHELSITKMMLDLVLEEAETNEASRVERICLVVGEMSGIVDDCVRFYFDLLSQNTIAEGAEIRFRSVPATARCRECGKEFKLKGCAWGCPDCGRVNVEIAKGKELYVESIEVK